MTEAIAPTSQLSPCLAVRADRGLRRRRSRYLCGNRCSLEPRRTALDVLLVYAFTVHGGAVDAFLVIASMLSSAAHKRVCSAHPVCLMCELLEISRPGTGRGRHRTVSFRTRG